MSDKKIAYHPNNKHIITFDEGPHTYVDNFGKQYVSATTFIGGFFDKFDMVAMSRKCSKGVNPKYVGRTPDDILDEWTREGDRGRTEGTNTHEYAEGLMCGWSVLLGPISGRCVNLFIQVNMAVKKLLSHFVLVGAEIIVFSPKLGLAGMIDLLMFDPIRRRLLILDWKQNKKLSRHNQWQKAHAPIDHLQETDINKYSLQLSLYKKIIEMEGYFPDIDIIDLGIIHLQEFSYENIKMESFDYEIRELIKWQK